MRRGWGEIGQWTFFRFACFIYVPSILPESLAQVIYIYIYLPMH